MFCRHCSFVTFRSPGVTLPAARAVHSHKCALYCSPHQLLLRVKYAVCYFCQTLTKLRFSWRASVIVFDIQYHRNLSNWSWLVWYGRTDRICHWRCKIILCTVNTSLQLLFTEMCQRDVLDQFYFLSVNVAVVCLCGRLLLRQLFQHGILYAPLRSLFLT
jgi:hypothetical protein